MKQELCMGELRQQLAECDYVLIGIGAEWQANKNPEIRLAYEALHALVKDKNHFIVTTITEGIIYETQFEAKNITAPCGNINWKQCEEACTKDIWEAKEVQNQICPHCGAPLISNTVEAKTYIEEGYLPQWQAYTRWLTHTFHKRLIVLELGEDFRRPTVIRWPFEKTVFFNQQSYLYRINENFPQISGEIKDRACSVSENSVKFLTGMM